MGRADLGLAFAEGFQRPGGEGQQRDGRDAEALDPSDARASRRAPASNPPSEDMNQTSGSQTYTQMAPSRWKAIAATMKAMPASQGWKTRRTQLFSDSPNQITKKPSAIGTRKVKLRLMMAQSSLFKPSEG